MVNNQPTGFKDLLNSMMKRRWFITAIVLGGFMFIMAGIFAAIIGKNEIGGEWKELLLLLLSAFIESLREIRSYLLWKYQDWKNPMDQVKGLMALRNAFQQTVTPLLDSASNQGEIPDRKVVSKLNVEALGMNLAFVMHFWLKDDSADFERTDACIEKSVQLTMDFVGRNAVDKLFDLGKFLIQGFQK